MRNRRVRLSDIAEQTGYSISTVSKALNGRSDIPERTRIVIENTMTRIGYQKRASHKNVTRNGVEVVFKKFENIWALEILQGVLNEMRPLNLGVTITERGDNCNHDSSWVTEILNRKPIGLILVFSDLSEVERSILQAHDVPFVIFDPAGDPYPSDFSIQADNWTGGIIATRHLLVLGHTRIGMITGPTSMLCSRARFDGFTAALDEHKVQLDSKFVKNGDFTTASGYNNAMELLSSSTTRPSAIFAGNDLQAMGVYEASRQLGIRIPEDLSVVGFDDVQTAAFMGPPLTTVRQPLTEMARQAAHLIITKMRSNTEQRHLILPTNLVIRNSTQPPSQ